MVAAKITIRFWAADAHLPYSSRISGGVGNSCPILAARAETTKNWRKPVFDVTLFNLPSFCWGGVVSFLRTLSMFIVNYGLVLYLQLYEGVPALHAAMISFPNAPLDF